MSIRVCFYLSLKDNIIRLDMDEEGVRKGGKGREREGKKDGWVRSLHLWQGPGYWCTGHLYGTWQFAPGSMFCFFRSLSFLSLSPSSFTCNDYINNSM